MAIDIDKNNVAFGSMESVHNVKTKRGNWSFLLSQKEEMKVYARPEQMGFP
jgi:hypothetical protein